MLTAGAQTLNNYLNITAAYNVDDIHVSIFHSPAPLEVARSKCAIHRKDSELHLRIAKAQIQVSLVWLIHTYVDVLCGYCTIPAIQFEIHSPHYLIEWSLFY